ncbi:MAG TPA: universal stress protein [Vicinamibacterales bacterium]|nr:universal stress protein [Vicinamibacterales bacterium]
MTPDIQRIFVPVDFSSNSRRALDYARGLAEQFGAALHVVHVCEVPTIMTPALDAYAIAYSDWSQRLGEEAEKQLLAIKASVGGVKVTTEVLFGSPASAIVESAEANAADLIVMGTHGHGAVMHVLMGNVAERVVRTASCPVLTVREPRVKADRPARAEAPVKATNLVASFLMAVALILGAMAGPAAAQEYKQYTPGAELFRTYCASCHGTTARGDGPLASAMNKKPANLTEIAQRNGGSFPSELVFKTIDGRQPVRGHGGPDMPVWGDAFSRSREAGDVERVKAVIKSLVDYLESIQLRPAHQ